MSGAYLARLASVVLMGGCSDASLASAARGADDARPVAVVCAPAAGAEVEQADLICSEFMGALAATRPDLRFVSAGQGHPSARLTITHANARSLGLAVVWTDAAGRRTDSAPMQVSFFDRASDPVMRGDFYRAFLSENPPPF